MIPDRQFTLAELRRHDGEQKAALYIAYDGVVYDVTNCPKWRSGMHEGLHFPAQDLTSELPEAPHAVDVFKYPCVKPVGRLAAE